MKLTTRVERLERRGGAPAPPPTVRLWLDLDDGTVRCKETGETLSAADFERLHPKAIRINLDERSEDHEND